MAAFRPESFRMSSGIWFKARRVLPARAPMHTVSTCAVSSRALPVAGWAVTTALPLSPAASHLQGSSLVPQLPLASNRFRSGAATETLGAINRGLSRSASFKAAGQYAAIQGRTQSPRRVRWPARCQVRLSGGREAGCSRPAQLQHSQGLGWAGPWMSGWRG